MSVERNSSIVQKEIDDISIGNEVKSNDFRKERSKIKLSMNNSSYLKILRNMDCIEVYNNGKSVKFEKVNRPGEICEGCHYNVPARTKISGIERCALLPEEG